MIQKMKSYQVITKSYLNGFNFVFFFNNLINCSFEPYVKRFYKGDN